jgi:hypothetical protein
MKSLIYGVTLIILLGIGGLVYRNAVEHPSQATACPVSKLRCPDSTFVQHLPNSCEFPLCPFPNVSFPDVHIAFAVPEGFESGDAPDANLIAYYQSSVTSSTTAASIEVLRFPIAASSTALATIQQTAVGGASEMPVSATSFTSTVVGSHRFTVVTLGRFEGVVDTAYYLARNDDVLRFDAVDKGVVRWNDSTLDVSTLPANKALRKLLSTLE